MTLGQRVPVQKWHRITEMFEKIPAPLLLLLARLGMAGIFWRSGMTKITIDADVSNFSLQQMWAVASLNWSVSDFTYILFENDYALPFLAPRIAAHLALLAELTLPVLLALGLFTRLSALAMLGMTLVIQLFVFPYLWPDHSLWAAALLLLVAKGAGCWSLDFLVVKGLKC
ncbi:DoxX family protein [Emcibacter nanhaiensis]|uniref:DoxX family membrane protein n=1 Tax=Emcibacter nanhaiensis TaxID=1505037 RepID=A0A501PRF6_9PROT|nr:DoxX family protein [Emcibacter nanhaiensis]TPD62662.1 DoxX family membrane protein [Emcibacter nanhaiensis]